MATHDVQQLTAQVHAHWARMRNRRTRGVVSILAGIAMIGSPALLLLAAGSSIGPWLPYVWVAASLGGFALLVTAMVFLFQSHKARILAEVANAKIVETDPGASVLNSASSRVFRRAYKAVR